MISFDYITLKAFIAENRDLFQGAKLQKVQQPTRRDVILTLRTKDGVKKFYVNINPQLYHLCFASKESLEKRHISVPKKPPMFCMLLRKYLEGARIVDIKIPPYERIFEMLFESYNELNEKNILCLGIELMGRHSNIILYDYSSKIILGCIHNVGEQKSRSRELSGTIPYIYPPKQNKSDFLRFFGDVRYETLNGNFLGISKTFEDLFMKNQVQAEKIKDYLELKSPVTPAVSGDIYSIYGELLENPVFYESVNSMIDNYYSKMQSLEIKTRLKTKLKNIITPKLEKTLNSITEIRTQIRKNDNAEVYRKYGDLIMSHIFDCNDYVDEIEVFDWEVNENIIISLDKTKTLKENAARYYKLYSRSKKSKEKLLHLETELIEKSKYFEQILYTISSADSAEVLSEIYSECITAGLVRDENVSDKTKTEIQKTRINGYDVYIGRNNRQNDFLTTKIASPEDYWFHARNCPGSHVVLKLPNKNVPDEDTLYKCALLAKKYSASSNDTKSGIIYTRRKYLKKPPKSNLGYITYKNEREIIVCE